MLRFTDKTLAVGTIVISLIMVAPLLRLVERDLRVKVGSSQSVRIDYDLNEDGAADILTYVNGSGRSVWRGYALDGLDSLKRGAGKTSGASFSWDTGAVNGIPVPGDYNGDGLLDLAVYLPEFKPDPNLGGFNWQIFFSGAPELGSERYSSAKPLSLYWGNGNARAVPADYDGDGATDVAVFVPEFGMWQVLFSAGGFNQAKGLLGAGDAGESMQWGLPSDTPVPGDYNADGCADYAVVREEKKELAWYIKYRPCKGGLAQETAVIKHGSSADTLVAADYNGDGAFQPAVFRPANGRWYIFQPRGKSGEELEVIKWTVKGALPFASDVDGDGSAELGLYLAEGNGKYRWKFRRWGLSDGVKEAFGDQQPVVAKIRRGFIDDKSVQVLLREHQAGEVD